MSPWIEAHSELRAHPKMLALAEELKIEQPTAIGFLLGLWWWTAAYAADGDLSRFCAAQVARGAGWPGDPSIFVEALKSAGFLEAADGRLEIHDWQAYRLHYDAAQERRERRLAKTRERVSRFRASKRARNAEVTQPVTPKLAAKVPNLNNRQTRKEPPPDAVALQDQLETLLKANGVTDLPSRSASIKTATLLLERDGRRLDDAKALLAWACGHEFWRGNILSIEAFRKQYERLRLQREAEQRKIGSRVIAPPREKYGKSEEIQIHV